MKFIGIGIIQYIAAEDWCLEELAAPVFPFWDGACFGQVQNVCA